KSIKPGRLRVRHGPQPKPQNSSKTHFPLKSASLTSLLAFRASVTVQSGNALPMESESALVLVSSARAAPIIKQITPAKQKTGHFMVGTPFEDLEVTGTSVSSLHRTAAPSKNLSEGLTSNLPGAML